MRTTIDLPDELYRTLRARAAMQGVTLRELVRGLIVAGLAEPAGDPGPRGTQRPTLPVAIPSSGRTISITPEDIHRLEEEDDLERYARSLGR